MSAVRSAVALLTRFPVATAETDTPGAAAFGLVGACVGLTGAIPFAVLAGSLAEPWLAAIAAIATMVVLTGALHLDGLADTADAVMAADHEASERARKDPHVGTGGLVAILLVVAAEIAALVSLEPGGATRGAMVLIVVASASRVVPVLLTVGVGRVTDLGTTHLGTWFADHVTPIHAAVALVSTAIVTVVLTLIGGLVVPLAATAALVGGTAAGGAIVALRGGLDGDGMGAAVELSVVTGLVAAALAS
jgi:adenosylcobinamide-GDP ribazoletransferase